MSNARELAELGGSYGTGGFVGMKNRIINGEMRIDQRNAGASVSVSSTTYVVDRFPVICNAGSGHTGQQSSTAPAGLKNSLLVTIGTGASPSSGSVCQIYQAIEGLNVYDLSWGTASAASVTLSFWVRSSVTGTFSGAVSNSALNRSYAFTYTINSANTFEYKTVTIPGDTSGTWLTTNGVGIYLILDLGCGSTYQGSAGTWSAADYRAVTGSTKLVATSGATFYITGVQFEKGSTATSFDYRPYGTELALCQRYYYKHSTGAGQVIASISCYSSTRIDCAVKLPVTMRSSPTLDVASGSNYFQAYAGNYSQQFSTMLLNSAQPNSVLLYNNAVSGFTEGRAGWLENVNASAYLAFSAEL